MKRRIKFLISALLNIVVIAIFFLPVYHSKHYSISVFDFVKNYFIEGSLKYPQVEGINVDKIISYNEFFVVLILGTAILGLLFTIILLLIPRNRSALVPAFFGFAGLFLTMLILNNIYMTSTLAGFSIRQLGNATNVFVLIIILGLFFIVTIYNFVISTIKESKMYKKTRRMGKVTQIIHKRKKMGTALLSPSGRHAVVIDVDDDLNDDDSTIITDKDVVEDFFNEK